MSEKRGLQDQSLKNDYNTAGVLEVWVPKLNGWYRVTSRDFRSFDGKRRITEPTETIQGDVWNVNIASRERIDALEQRVLELEKRLREKDSTVGNGISPALQKLLDEKRAQNE